MITKKIILTLTAAACCMAGVAASGVAESAVFCFPASVVNNNRLPFGNATAQTWGCNVTNAGGTADGKGQSQTVSGVKRVCANLLVGDEVSVRGLDNLGNGIAGCGLNDNVVGGGFSCDTTGCATAQSFDVSVEDN